LADSADLQLHMREKASECNC